MRSVACFVGNRNLAIDVSECVNVSKGGFSWAGVGK